MSCLPPCKISGDFGPTISSRRNLRPSSPPDVVVSVAVSREQALLYRLSGDYNAIHADHKAARSAGLDGPILHGLCSLGKSECLRNRRCTIFYSRLGTRDLYLDAWLYVWHSLSQSPDWFILAFDCCNRYYLCECVIAGIAARQILLYFCKGDPSRLKFLYCRFSRTVRPGEELEVRLGLVFPLCPLCVCLWSRRYFLPPQLCKGLSCGAWVSLGEENK